MATKRKLSKSILEMKFMQRTKEKVEKEAEIEETKRLYKQNINNKMLNNKESNFYYEPSYVVCEDLIDGRLSFRGMNIELEKYIEKQIAEKETAVVNEQEKEVDDEEMATIFGKMKKFNNIATVQAEQRRDKSFMEKTLLSNKSYNTNYEPANKKRQFMKPTENN